MGKIRKIKRVFNHKIKGIPNKEGVVDYVTFDSRLYFFTTYDPRGKNYSVKQEVLTDNEHEFSLKLSIIGENGNAISEAIACVKKSVKNKYTKEFEYNDKYTQMCTSNAFNKALSILGIGLTEKQHYYEELEEEEVTVGSYAFEVVMDKIRTSFERNAAEYNQRTVALKVLQAVDYYDKNFAYCFAPEVIEVMKNEVRTWINERDGLQSVEVPITKEVKSVTTEPIVNSKVSNTCPVKETAAQSVSDNLPILDVNNPRFEDLLNKLSLRLIANPNLYEGDDLPKTLGKFSEYYSNNCGMEFSDNVKNALEKSVKDFGIFKKGILAAMKVRGYSISNYDDKINESYQMAKKNGFLLTETMLQNVKVAVSAELSKANATVG